MFLLFKKTFIDTLLKRNKQFDHSVYEQNNKLIQYQNSIYKQMISKEFNFDLVIDNFIKQLNQYILIIGETIKYYFSI
ncbi:unnamed protein product [Paramecium pentaurelia]|uniref:Uncharacterized protein n=1 Tax=Paramecium pentaurelia TaxID=43138 RepID=A0A8S1SUF5_9CILI|nr:unnamed protein product [Paramecium pentaurelia]